MTNLIHQPSLYISAVWISVIRKLERNSGVWFTIRDLSWVIVKFLWFNFQLVIFTYTWCSCKKQYNIKHTLVDILVLLNFIAALANFNEVIVDFHYQNLQFLVFYDFLFLQIFHLGLFSSHPSLLPLHIFSTVVELLLNGQFAKQSWPNKSTVLALFFRKDWRKPQRTKIWTSHLPNAKVKVEVKFTVEQTMKAQTGIRSTALLFL